MPVDIMFDGALLVISGCCALYCWTLSRRLRALQNLRKGMGQAMVNLTRTVSSVETNAAKLNREASAAVTELRDVLTKVDGAEGRVDLLLETLDSQSREVWKDYRRRADDTIARLEKVTAMLDRKIDTAEDLTRTLGGTPGQAERLVEVTRESAVEPVVAGRTRSGSNPFSAELEEDKPSWAIRVAGGRG